MGETELTSGLPEAHQRFLAKYLEAARRAGVISNKQLFERFPHERLFAGYKDEPQSRAKLLCANSKMPFEIAVELDVNGCVQVFSIALAKLKEATADKVFAVVTADELVRVMLATELYAFVDETKWDEQDTPAHRELVSVLLREFKAEDLGGGTTRTLHAIEDAIGIDLYVEHLPKTVLTAIIRGARGLADKNPGNVAFTVDAMDEIATTELLGKHLPIPVLMRPIRAAAETFGFVKKPEPAYVPPPPPPSTPSFPPSGDGDEGQVPTIPPVKKPDGDDPEVLVTPDGSGSAPSDEDAEIERLLAEEARNAAAASGTGDPPLSLDDEDDGKTEVGAIPRPGGSPPPLPRPGQTTGRRRNS